MVNVSIPNTATSLAGLPYLRERILTFTILPPLWPAIILFGLLSNVTNMIVFIKSGVKDNVTTLLLSLAVSDAVFLGLMAPTVCAFIIYRFAPNWDWPFHNTFISYLFYWPAFTVYDFSAFISVSLGVTRCACVAMPLRFKSVFTKARTVKLVIALFLLCVILRIPILSTMKLAWRTEVSTNVSYLYVASQRRKEMTKINDALNRNSLPWTNFIIMISCVVILSVKLREASNVRWSLHVTAAPTSHAKPSHQSTDPPGTAANQKMSSKDIQVVQSVVLVCGIFIFAQIPFMMYSTVRLLYPEFDQTGRLRYLFSVCTMVSRTFSYINASFNIFVYYNYNSKYRAVLQSILNLKRNDLKELDPS